MNKIAKFSKVSYEQFAKDWKDTFKDNYGYDYEKIEKTEKEIKKIYDNIKLPIRATSGSAGYDFKSPIDITLGKGETIKIPTGIRVKMNPDWVLTCFPRSGLGFKFRLQLDNTVGVIDSDYFYSDNEGHIFAKITNDSKSDKIVKINAGDGFIQGIFLPFGITTDDNATGIRNGGFGSTTERNSKITTTYSD
jgi:dUTP pyrophosphatase